MKRARIALLLGISTGLAAFSVSAWADDVVRWKTIIGIIMPGNLVGTIPGGGQPWSTTGGEAKVNLDPRNVQSGWVDLHLSDLGVDAPPFEVHDLLSGASYTWSGARHYLELRPHEVPAHILLVGRNA